MLARYYEILSDQLPQASCVNKNISLIKCFNLFNYLALEQPSL